MTTQKLFKRRVRERMAKTGESYTPARRHVGRTRERLEDSRADLSVARELASDEKLIAATGHDWTGWLETLDQWGARRRSHGETVEHLMAAHAVPGWYAQAITNGYERTRGMRLKHQQSDGFTVYASRTVNVPIGMLFDAFVDDAVRATWLSLGSMSRRSSQANKVARFDWGDGRTGVMVTFDEKGPSKATASVAHGRLLDPDEAEVVKAAWKLRLTELKSLLEARPRA